MSTLQIDHESSLSAQNRLHEVVCGEPAGSQPRPSLVPGPFDALEIALIGPDDQSRNQMARALAASGIKKVHAFASYPPSLDEAPALLMESHNVVIIEIDSNPKFALDLVEQAVAVGPLASTVMVYSAKSDPELMVRCMRAGVREFLVPPFESLLPIGALTRAAARLSLEETGNVEGNVSSGRLLTFMGAKGGTGVTTLACNFAVALAQESGQKTLLIDLDLPFGDVALSLGVIPEYSTINALEASDRLDASFLKRLVVEHRSGLFVLAAPGSLGFYRPSVAEVDKLLTVARQAYDNVVVDIGTRLDLTETSIFRDAHAVYLVTQAGIPELRNSNRLISQYFAEDGPKLEIIINRYQARKFDVSEAEINRALTRSARWKIPNDYNSVRQMQINASPLSIENSPVSREIRRMAGALNGDRAVQRKKKAFGLFG